MRGKKVLNSNQLQQNTHLKMERPQLKKRINEVKSLQHKVRIQPMTMQTQQMIRLPPQNTINDYEIQRQQRQNHPYKYANQTNCNPILITQNPQQFSRFQRNTQGPIPIKQRENYLLNGSLNRSHQGSQQKIQMVAIDSKQKSVSRSQNSSAKKRGIELTKTLLKRISGMYNDKDFTNRASNKSQREETTAKMTMSGRGVCDQYQISDFDFQLPNQTINTSNSNQLSFNDSGHWKNSINCTNNTSTWNKQSAQLTSSYQENAKNSQPLQSNKYSQNILPEQLSQKPIGPSPKKQLLKVRSYNLINTQQTAQSVIVGGEPPQRGHLTRRCQGNVGGQSRQRYLIRSKNKTMDQMSLKQSMVLGNDHYYQ